MTVAQLFGIAPIPEFSQKNGVNRSRRLS